MSSQNGHGLVHEKHKIPGIMNTQEQFFFDFCIFYRLFNPQESWRKNILLMVKKWNHKDFFYNSGNGKKVFEASQLSEF